MCLGILMRTHFAEYPSHHQVYAMAQAMVMEFGPTPPVLWTAALVPPCPCHDVDVYISTYQRAGTSRSSIHTICICMMGWGGSGTAEMLGEPYLRRTPIPRIRESRAPVVTAHRVRSRIRPRTVTHVTVHKHVRRPHMSDRRPLPSKARTPARESTSLTSLPRHTAQLLARLKS